MVISEIRSLYRDENDLFWAAIKRIYEEWDAEQEQRHGWLYIGGLGIRAKSSVGGRA